MILKMLLSIMLLISSVPVLLYPQDYKSPESAVFDYSGNCYFITNFGSGDIIKFDSNGVKGYFIRGLSKPLGTVIFNNVLYLVENGNTVRGYEISDSTEVLNLKIDGAKFLNDITADSLDNLYITDIRMNKVISVNLKTSKYATFVNTIFEAPNGIIYEKSGDRLLVCYFNGKAAVQAISINDTSITTLYSNNLINLDGITEDSEGNIYVSDWGPGSFSAGFNKKGVIYKFDNKFKNPPEIIYSKNYGPADIFFNKRANCLVVPSFLDNALEFIQKK
jgi:sugar lactone lactonase YvrE